MYENMTLEQIQNLIQEEIRLETNKDITREKRLEILKLHRILVKRRLVYKFKNLAERANLLECYDIVMHEGNIERYYNMKVQTFVNDHLLPMNIEY